MSRIYLLKERGGTYETYLTVFAPRLVSTATSGITSRHDQLSDHYGLICTFPLHVLHRFAKAAQCASFVKRSESRNNELIRYLPIINWFLHIYASIRWTTTSQAQRGTISVQARSQAPFFRQRKGTIPLILRQGHSGDVSSSFRYVTWADLQTITVNRWTTGWLSTSEDPCLSSILTKDRPNEHWTLDVEWVEISWYKSRS